MAIEVQNEESSRLPDMMSAAALKEAGRTQSSLAHAKIANSRQVEASHGPQS